MLETVRANCAEKEANRRLLFFQGFVRPRRDRRGPHLLQGQRVLPHLRDPLGGGPRAHLPLALHHRLPQEAAAVRVQVAGPAGDVLARHRALRHPGRRGLPAERRLCQAADA